MFIGHYALGLGAKSVTPCVSLGALFLAWSALYAVGVWLYLRATAARDRIGSIGLWALLLFLALVQFANIFGPPPPSVTAVTLSAQAMWLLVLWGYWVDRHRQGRAVRMSSSSDGPDPTRSRCG
jgi:hypothetical protein